MKKAILLGGVLLCFLGLAGCGKKPDHSVEEQKIQAEDREQSRTYMEMTDQGYYYYSWEDGGFRYKDAATGKDMFLCNKPECKHDGNGFCVATNEKYRISTFCIYSGMIFVAAIEETDTQYLHKLLTISLDGSELLEFATYATVEKSEQQAIPGYFAAERLLIYRNKAVLPIEWCGQAGLTDSNHYGTAILDLETKEIVWLDETPIARENTYISDACAVGDYLYYTKLEKKRTLLYRYHLTEQTTERYSLRTGFQGVYAVADENTVAYITSSAESLYVYHLDTGLDEEKVVLERKKAQYLAGQWFEKEERFTAIGLVFDGTHFFVPEAGRTAKWLDEETGEVVNKTECLMHIFNRDLEETACIDLAKELYGRVWDDGQLLYANRSTFNAVGDELYVKLYPSPEELWGTCHIFRCKKSDLLAGNPQFTYVYSDVQ